MHIALRLCLAQPDVGKSGQEVTGSGQPICRRPSTTQAVAGHEGLGAEGLPFQAGGGEGGQPTSRRAVSAAVPVRPVSAAA